MLKNFIPSIDWIKNYRRQDLSGDFSAGLTVGVMLIPQGMAYAMLAGLPPIYGLYASSIPLIIYAIFGTSRQLAVGPVAMVALLISSGVSALAVPGSSEFIEMTIVLALMVGVIQFLMGLFRLGFVVNFLSHPVISGFTSAAALIIGFSQLKHLLGFDIPRGKVHETLIYTFSNLGDINTPTLLIGSGAIILLIVLKKISKKIPGPLVVVLLGTGAVYLFDLFNIGVGIVGEVPGGLPEFGVPSLSIESMQSLLPIALTISFIGFMESIAVAKAIEAKHKSYEVKANNELMGLGLANIAGSFFRAFPVTGGFSRTAVNDQSGANTGLSSVISAVLIILTLLFLTSLFYFLPKAILAAIIIVAVAGLVDVKEARHLWKTDRRDLILFLVTAVGTLVLGIEEGIIMGVLLSLVMVIFQVSYPHAAVLGNVPGTEMYRNISRFPEVTTFDGIIILRFDAQLYFANSSYFREFVNRSLKEVENIKAVILDSRAINRIDSTGIQVIKDLIEDLENLDIEFHFAQVKGPVRDILSKNDIDKNLGQDRLHMDVHSAVEQITGKKDSSEKHPTIDGHSQNQ